MLVDIDAYNDPARKKELLYNTEIIIFCPYSQDSCRKELLLLPMIMPSPSCLLIFVNQKSVPKSAHIQVPTHLAKSNLLDPLLQILNYKAAKTINQVSIRSGDF